MAALHSLSGRIKEHSFKWNSPLYLASLLMLFFTLFDGIIAYTAPILVSENGYSGSQLGWIMASSSLAGASFDFILSKFLRNSSYKRLYFLMLIMGGICTALFWQATNLLVFLTGMAIWGLYYDLRNFGNYNFISTVMPHDQHAAGFGVMDTFKNLGYFLATMIASALIVDEVTNQSFLTAGLFLGMSGVLYWRLTKLTAPLHPPKVKAHPIKALSFLMELKEWRQVGRQLLPVLLFVWLLNIFDAFFWVVGPLFSESLGETLAGELFMSMYFLPYIFVGWFVGSITHRLGKKNTAYLAFLIACLLIISLSFLQHNQFVLLSLIFIVSCVVGICWPAMEGAYADYISETPKAESEIEGLVDFFTNLGYIVGPIIAGTLADWYGNAEAFTLLGMGGAVAVLVIRKLTPGSIRVTI